MRILLIMDPGIPVPPVTYGGIERIVYLLAEEYHRLGHEVVLLAGPGSYCSGKTISFGKNEFNRSKTQKYKEILFVWKYLYTHSKHFDIVHNFGRLIYLLPILNHSVKKIMSYQRAVTPENIRIANLLPHKNLKFTACSSHCVSTGNIAGSWHTVYNTIDFSKYQLVESVAPDAPLMFLGRLDRIKGAHTAIKVAKATGNTLIVAGNIPDTADNFAYYKSVIEPEFDNEQIIYVGALNDEQKNKYLGKSKALLFPIEWDEPFGIVMIEAMACGTPVIALNKGSVPEVVTEGATGYIVNDHESMIAAVDKLKLIDRKACRETANGSFDIKVVARHYLELFNEHL